MDLTASDGDDLKSEGVHGDVHEQWRWYDVTEIEDVEWMTSVPLRSQCKINFDETLLHRGGEMTLLSRLRWVR